MASLFDEEAGKSGDEEDHAEEEDNVEAEVEVKPANDYEKDGFVVSDNEKDEEEDDLEDDDDDDDDRPKRKFSRLRKAKRDEEQYARSLVL